MVNVLYCSESPWRGDGELCRWCNARRIRGAKKKFCSVECSEAYYTNHIYTRAREACYQASVGPCHCRDWQLSNDAHGHCAACKRCEGQLREAGEKLTCNHIDMRNGIPMGLIHCIHHVSNLEMLCWPCHNALNMRGNKGRPWAESS